MAAPGGRIHTQGIHRSVEVGSAAAVAAARIIYPNRYKLLDQLLAPKPQTPAPKPATPSPPGFLDWLKSLF